MCMNTEEWVSARSFPFFTKTRRSTRPKVQVYRFMRYVVSFYFFQVFSYLIVFAFFIRWFEWLVWSNFYQEGMQADIKDGRHGTDEFEAVLGEPQHNWREWEAEEESWSPSPGEPSLGIRAPEEVHSAWLHSTIFLIADSVITKEVTLC